jgi:hypothetical protein
MPGEDTVEFTEVRDVSRRADGMLHLLDGVLLLEWAVTESVDEVGLSNVSSTTETFAAEEMEIPLEWLAGVELVGGILRPRLMLHARSLRVFEGIPGAKGARLDLRYDRSDRMVAVALVRAIEAALLAPPVEDSGETPRLAP